MVLPPRPPHRRCPRPRASTSDASRPRTLVPDPASPTRAAAPVTHQPMPTTSASHATIVHRQRGVVRERLCPVRHERVTVARRKRGHRRCLRITLVLVEHRQIRLDDPAQDTHAPSVPRSRNATRLGMVPLETALGGAGGTAAAFGRAADPRSHATCGVERRGRDSNPRYALTTHNGFRDRRIQPLCHPSRCPRILDKRGRGGQRFLA